MHYIIEHMQSPGVWVVVAKADQLDYAEKIREEYAQDGEAYRIRRRYEQ